MAASNKICSIFRCKLNKLTHKGTQKNKRGWKKRSKGFWKGLKKGRNKLLGYLDYKKDILKGTKLFFKKLFLKDCYCYKTKFGKWSEKGIQRYINIILNDNFS